MGKLEELVMNNHFDEIINRRNSDSVKWNLYPENVLPLWVADMDFLSPQPVIEALEKRIHEGMFGYPCMSEGLISAGVDWVKNRHGWQILPEQVLIIPAIISGFNLAARAFANKRPLIMQTPAYMPFFHVADHAGITQIDNPMIIGTDQYEIDFDDFEKSAAQGAGIFLLCNPHNPSGRVFTRNELERMAEICLRHDITIISDEIHSDLVYSGQRHIPIASLSPEVAKKTITLIATSKTFNLAGLKTALAIVSSNDIKKTLLSADLGLMGSANLVGQLAAETAYRQGLPWLQDLLVYLESNRDTLIEFIQKELPGIKCFAPQATYLAWLDCRALNLPNDDPYHFFLEKAKVGVNNGADFGKPGKGFIRINFGCPRPILMDALNRMRNALIQNGFIH